MKRSRQQAAVRGVLRAAVFAKAAPPESEIADELENLRMPATAIALVGRYASALADEAATMQSTGALHRAADLLALDVCKDLGPADSNRVTGADIAEAQSIRRQRSGGVKVSGDGGLVNVAVDRDDGPVSGRDVGRAPWSQ